jgi:glycerophosphoryl diester phosphodiesterase
VSTSPYQRIGHGGASALAPANTLASFDAAQEIGVDMVEFDVRECEGELVLAHTPLRARRGGNVRLGDALDHLSGQRFDGIGLNIDVKRLGCESALVESLRWSGWLQHALISSQVPAVLDRVRALEPRTRVAISIAGRVSRLWRWSDWRTETLAGLVAQRWDAVMAQHRLVDSRLLEEVDARGGLVFAWTVNERSAIERLRILGVHGIATADPRLFI